MVNPEHVAILQQGVEAWNKWRDENPNIKPDLSEAKLKEAKLSRANLTGVDFSNAFLSGSDFSKANLIGANLVRASLFEANLREANLSKANLRGANLTGANLSKANLSGARFFRATLIKAKLKDAVLRDQANLSKADLTDADLRNAELNDANLQWANLNETNFKGANLSRADLSGAQLLKTKLKRANLSGCRIYGISAWDLELKEANQSNLIINRKEDPDITVDKLEVAQFIYLLLSRKKLRDVIDTITSKSVLILGRFTSERKAVLDSMATELRKYNLVPIIFDFERASSRDFTETIKTLAGMSLFVIADITNPSSAPLELQATVPDYQIPFVPILQEGEKPFSMLADLKSKYQWVLPLLKYSSTAVLLQVFKKAIIDEAFEMHKKLLRIKADEMETRNAEDYLKESVS